MVAAVQRCGWPQTENRRKKKLDEGLKADIPKQAVGIFYFCIVCGVNSMASKFLISPFTFLTQE